MTSNTQVNSNSSSIANLAQSAKKFDKEFSDKLRQEGIKRFSAVEDLLLEGDHDDVNRAKKAIEGLKDLRSGLMTVHSRTADTALANHKAARSRAAGMTIGQELKDSETSDAKPFAWGWGEGRNFQRRFSPERARVVRNETPQGQKSTLKYIRELSSFISLASAAVAISPAPTAMAISQINGQKDGLTSNERVFAEADQLRMRLEQTSTATSDLNIIATRESVDEGTFGLLWPRKVQNPSRFWGENVESRLVETLPMYESHLLIPDSPL